MKSSPHGLTALLVFYILQGLAIIFLLRWRQQSTSSFRFLVHGADVVWPAVISLVTTGQSSPFFLFFVFVIAAAALRWGLWETVATAVSSVSLLWLDSLALHFGRIGVLNHWLRVHHLPAVLVDEADFEPKRLLMRSVYLVVMGLLLGYLAEQQKKLRTEKDVAARLLGLVRMDAGLGGTLSEIVERLMRMYSSPKALVASRDSENPRVSVGTLELKNGMPLKWSGWIPDYRVRKFICARARRRPATSGGGRARENLGSRQSAWIPKGFRCAIWTPGFFRDLKPRMDSEA